MNKANNEADAVTFEDHGDKLTITVTGEVYANLRRVADAMNKVSWTDDDNTPDSVCEFWIGGLLRRVGDSPDVGSCNVTDLTTDIQDGIDTGAVDGSETDKARRRELEAAFDAIDWNA